MVAGIHYLIRYESGLGDPGKQMLDRVNGAGQRLRRLLDELELCAWIDGAPPSATPPARALPPRHGRPRRGRPASSAPRRASAAPPSRSTCPRTCPRSRSIPSSSAPRWSTPSTSPWLDRPTRRCTWPPRSRSGAPVLRITDEGGVLEASALERIFQPFAEKDLVPRPRARRPSSRARSAWGSPSRVASRRRTAARSRPRARPAASRSRSRSSVRVVARRLPCEASARCAAPSRCWSSSPPSAVIRRPSPRRRVTTPCSIGP